MTITATVANVILVTAVAIVVAATLDVTNCVSVKTSNKILVGLNEISDYTKAGNA